MNFSFMFVWPNNAPTIATGKCLRRYYEVKQKSGQGQVKVRSTLRGAEGPAEEIKSSVEVRARFFLLSTLQHFDSLRIRPLNYCLQLVTRAAPLHSPDILSVDRPSSSPSPSPSPSLSIYSTQILHHTYRIFSSTSLPYISTDTINRTRYLYDPRRYDTLALEKVRQPCSRITNSPHSLSCLV